MDYKTFEKDKYIFVKNAVSKDMCSLLTNYTLMKQEHEPNLEDAMVANTHATYADHAMEALLVNLLPIVEAQTKLTLYPTYSFYRVYKPGDVLKRHKDRPSCEISVSLTLGYEYSSENKDYNWTLWAGDTEFKFFPGDMLIYRGLELSHWREPFNVKSGWQSQVFLHYVDANGPYSNLIHDTRPNLGYPVFTRDNVLLENASVLSNSLLNKNV
jgi:hypothetical protein